MNLNNVKELVSHSFQEYLAGNEWQVRDKGNGFWIERHKIERVDFLYLNIKDHYDEQQLSKYHLVRPFCAIRFHEVETLMSELQGKFDDPEIVTIQPYEFYDGQMDDVLPKPLTGAIDKVGLDMQINIMLEYFDKYLKPFFEAYASLAQVDKKLSNLNDEDRLKFLPGSEGKSSLKHMIIAKLAENPDYETIEKKIGSSFEKVAQKVSRLSFLPELHQKLKTKLESIDPL